MSGSDKEQLMAMGFDPERVDCEPHDLMTKD